MAVPKTKVAKQPAKIVENDVEEGDKDDPCEESLEDATDVDEDAASDQEVAEPTPLDVHARTSSAREEADVTMTPAARPRTKATPPSHRHKVSAGSIGAGSSAGTTPAIPMVTMSLQQANATDQVLSLTP